MDRQEKTNYIRVCSLSPGLVRTEYVNPRPEDPTEMQSCGDLPCLEAKDLADSVLFVLASPKHVQIQDIVLSHKQDMSK